jgi:hypothetical protein
MVISLADVLDELVEAHAVEVGVSTTRDLMVGVAFVPHAVEGEKYVVGIEGPRGPEIAPGVEGDMVAQMEYIALASVF